MVELIQTQHPSTAAQKAFDGLVAIEEQKQALLTNLELLFDQDRLTRWQRQFHPSGLTVLEHVQMSSPLIILSGEVGCGKTALANAIGTPLVQRLGGKRVITLETPSNIRGNGMVGELSSRVSAAFKTAKAKVPKDAIGLLIIDEADDLATSRAQNQAHHEDRAGLNVLIKEIDQLVREKHKLVVLLITNRINVLDPAVRRRTSLHLNFERPTGERLKQVFEYLFANIEHDSEQLTNLIRRTQQRKVPFSFSDLLQRALRQAILEAIQNEQPLSVPIYSTVLETMEPSPMLEEATIH
ncbi:ATPase central domain-containing protein (plasmid) [Fibrisoma limi BUZ 3]|uniref:ATPase central domain-containing protein n=1 Tax=Fibrisoma limi BUZ 3 TaxID=1185876 RepID=I2GU26_9BACT|nr:ATP-binding protein [Fibrisoma limi]CCH57627.1 ATPase central domain-containing protein [Fibrisoma limi BUZ 3]